MEKIKKILSDILGIKISNKTTIDNAGTWDSFSHLLIMHSVEKTYKINFTMREIIKVKSYQDLKELIKKLINEKIKSR